SAPGPNVHLEFARVGDLVELAEQPALQRVAVPGQTHHLAGQRFAVDAWRGHVDDEQRPFEPAGQTRGVGEGVAGRPGAVVTGDNRVDEGNRARLDGQEQVVRAHRFPLAAPLWPTL